MKQAILTSFLLLIFVQTACSYLPRNYDPQKDESFDPLSVEWGERSFYQQGLIESQRPILDRLPGASEYHLDLQIADDLIHVTGIQEVRYTNREEVVLDEVHFRLYPNILGGSLTISEVSINGKSVTPSYSLAESLMCLTLIPTLQPDDSIVVRIIFAVITPTELETNYGVFASASGVLALAHIYPVIPVYDDEGWNEEIPPEQGDIVYADSSFFLVRVTILKKIVLVASGIEIDNHAVNNKQVVTFAAGPARDFYLAASPDYEIMSRTNGKLTIRSYAPKDLREGAQMALGVAEKAIADFSDRYSPYPYSEFEIISTPTYALGIEYPGIVAIADRIYDLSETINGVPASVILESTVAHEVGHQWFYNMVGNNQLDEPWLDESLTQYVTWQYYKDQYGSSGGSGFKQSLESRWDRVDRKPIPIGMPVSEYQDKEYGAIVYGRGAFFFDELAKQMGEATFNKFIQDYVRTYQWDIASGDDIKLLGERYCVCNLTPLFQEWIYPTP